MDYFLLQLVFRNHFSLPFSMEKIGKWSENDPFNDKKLYCDIFSTNECPGLIGYSFVHKIKPRTLGVTVGNVLLFIENHFSKVTRNCTLVHFLSVYAFYCIYNMEFLQECILKVKSTYIVAWLGLLDTLL